MLPVYFVSIKNMLLTHAIYRSIMEGKKRKHVHSRLFPNYPSIMNFDVSLQKVCKQLTAKLKEGH